ncbi:MAG: 1,4-alpha-glucan branching protein, partial [Acidobacteria bacterium]|nr:1,4-alpha-glucan branching protein [Acidobacteriota bacterium]
MLAMAVERKSRLRTADDALQAFANWLDRTKLDLRHPEDGAKISGWPSEARAPEVIDIGATMAAVNALISIRDLIEERLWELCERRFVARTQTKSLLDIDPVDLGARHERRLHRRLMRMARETSGSNYSAAEYSLVFHGPPGSSKTAMAEALAGDMWPGSGTHRLIRVTPADFTRQGEARLDSEARFIFDLLGHVRRVTVVFDEIDDLLRKRQQNATMSFLRLVVPAMLNRLQDLRDAAPRQEICFLFSTNYIDAIEPALTRPGRFDATIPVPYPDAWSRENILQRNIEEDRRGHPKRTILIDRTQQPVLIRETNAWPWSTFNKMCQELTASPAGTAKDIVIQLERHAAAVSDSISYYVRRDRWKEISRPLVQELLYSMFALSDLAQAKEKLREVSGQLPKRALQEVQRAKTLEEQLESEWHRDSRPEKWEHRATLPSRKVTGSKDRMGATATPEAITFRVWAPFARQVAIISDRMEAWKQPMDMQPMRDQPGVWELIFKTTSNGPEGTDSVDLTTPASQYRYVMMTGRGSPEFRSDPYAREWIEARPRSDARPVINSLALRRSADEVVRRPVDPARQIVCRIHPGLLDGELPLEAAMKILPRIRELGFNCVEIAPRGEPSTDTKWGYDLTMPYGLGSSSGGWSAIRQLVATAHSLDLRVIIGSAWGYGKRDSTDPLWRFDGWYGGAYEDGVYYGETIAGKSSLDLHEPQVCNLIFDRATECITELGMDGVHLMFADDVAKSERLQAMSLARDLAQELAKSDAFVWIDGAVDPPDEPGPCPFVCIDDEAILKHARGDAGEPVAWEKAFQSGGHTRVLSPGTLADPQSILRAVLAFALPSIPVVTWSDLLLNDDDPAVKLLQKLITYRTSSASPFATGAGFDVLTTDDDLPGVLNFRIGTGGREAVVLVNATESQKAFSFPTDGTWRVDLDTSRMEAFDQSGGLLAAADGSVDGHTNANSVKVLVRPGAAH